MAEPLSHIIGGTASFVTMLCTILPELARKQKEKANLEESNGINNVAKEVMSNNNGKNPTDIMDQLYWLKTAVFV